MKLTPDSIGVNTSQILLSIKISSKKTSLEVAQKGLKNLIHKDMKSGWGIAKMKRHYEKIIMSFMCGECSIGNVYILHMNLAIL